MNSNANTPGCGFFRVISSLLLVSWLLALVVSQAQAATFAEHGAEIRQLTNHSLDGLVVDTAADGTVSIDLRNHFQHAMLMQMGDDNVALSACVSNVSQASTFFGINLVTGAPLDAEAEKEHQALIEAARLHGMSPAEYQFYGDLIEGGIPAVQDSISQPFAGSSFNFTYTDGPTEGFFSTSAILLPAPGNDTAANLGEQRQMLLAAAALVWGEVLDTAVDIVVSASFDPLTCTPATPMEPARATLGSAGPAAAYGLNVPNDPTTVYPVALANKLVGSDIDPSKQDITTRLNSAIDEDCLGNGSRFYYGLDNAQPAGTINLFMTMLHELGHGLGFISFTDKETGAFAGGIQDIWARFLYDQTQDRTWDEMTDAQRLSSTTNNNNVFWDGPNVRIASAFLGSNGRDAATGRVQMYTPSTLEPGSSVSHFSTNASPNLLMEPILTPGLPTTLDITRQLMRDIGWYRDDDNDGAPATITNVTPSGGQYQSGSQLSVTWTNSSGFSRNVTIELSIDGGTTFPYTLAEDVSNTGTRLVLIPNVNTTQGRFRVREHNYVEPVGQSAVNVVINSNSPPTFTPGSAIALQQAVPAGPDPEVLGIVNDVESAEDSLVVTEVAGGTATGISVNDIGVAPNGTTFAWLSASCTATSGTVRFEVSDGELTDNGDVQMNVSPNAPPTLGAYTNAVLTPGQGTVLSPTAPPADNINVSSFTASILPATFTGSLSPDQATGNITVSNAAPEGTYTITATVTDNCGATAIREVQLQVVGDLIFDDGFEE